MYTIVKQQILVQVLKYATRQVRIELHSRDLFDLLAKHYAMQSTQRSFTKLSLIWQDTRNKGYPVKIELNSKVLQNLFTNHYAT